MALSTGETVAHIDGVNIIVRKGDWLGLIAEVAENGITEAAETLGDEIMDRALEWETGEYALGLDTDAFWATVAGVAERQEN